MEITQSSFKLEARNFANITKIAITHSIFQLEARNFEW